ncbi:hypothetical protein [Nostoc sp. FACHB-892]|nr:hypothetical protein [Nostoc sp. FACHB-892]
MILLILLAIMPDCDDNIYRIPSLLHLAATSQNGCAITYGGT